MTEAELRARIADVEAENLRLRLALLGTDAVCAHVWDVQNITLHTHAYDSSTYQAYEVCRVCFAERHRQVTRAWDQAYTRLIAELAATHLALNAPVQVAPDPPDVLTGILSAQVARSGGRCLICEASPALYCGLGCARQGR